MHFLSLPCYWIITYHIYLRILSNSMFTHITQGSTVLYNQQNILKFQMVVPCIWFEIRVNYQLDANIHLF